MSVKSNSCRCHLKVKPRTGTPFASRTFALSTGILLAHDTLQREIDYRALFDTTRWISISEGLEDVTLRLGAIKVL